MRKLRISFILIFASSYVSGNEDKFSLSCAGFDASGPEELGEIECNNEDIIRIESAVYGRSNTTECSAGNGAGYASVHYEICDSSLIVTTHVALECDGAPNCQFQGAYPNKFDSDPCPGTHKYVKIKYQCQCDESEFDCDYSKYDDDDEDYESDTISIASVNNPNKCDNPPWVFEPSLMGYPKEYPTRSGRTARAAIINSPNVAKDDFRCDFHRPRWTEKKVGGEKLAIPYAFHWTMPPSVRTPWNYWLKLMELDLGCIEFVEVDDAMNNPYENGILVTWDLIDSKNKRLARCFSKKGNAGNYLTKGSKRRSNGNILNPSPDPKLGRDQFRFYVDETYEYNQHKKNWQYAHFAPECLEGGNPQHEFMHSLGFMHQQASPARTDYIIVNEDALEKGGEKTSAYQMIQPAAHAISPYPFELDSLVMYTPKVFKKIDQKWKKVYYHHSLQEDDLLYGMTLNPKYMKKDAYPEAHTLWTENSRQITTTDALNIDWFYCKASSKYTYPTNKYTPGINTMYINKETTNCDDVDRIGIIRPVFNDRLCDGLVDCFDQSDENGVLADCEIDLERHPLEHNANCPYTLRATHYYVEDCVPTEEMNGPDSPDGNLMPAWRCHQGFEFDNDRRIYWTNWLTDDSGLQDENGNKNGYMAGTPGWVFSENEFKEKNLIAFHPSDGSDCPPEGKWKYTKPRMFERVFTYAKKNGVKMQSQPDRVKVCGHPNDAHNGLYYKETDEFGTEFNSYVSLNQESDLINVICFNEKNKIWVMSDEGYGCDEGFGSHHTKNMIDKTFGLIGTLWAAASKRNAKLPGETYSMSNEWSYEPNSLMVVGENVTCPYSKPLSTEIFVCGDESKYGKTDKINSRFELQSAIPKTNGFPFYRFVAELTDKYPNSLVIYWDTDSQSWIMNRDIGKPWGPYYKKGDFHNSGQWMLTPNHQGIRPDSFPELWIPSNLTICHKPCPTDFLEDLFICGAMHEFVVDGQYKLRSRDLVNGEHYYQYVGDINEPNSTLYLYWGQPIDGSKQIHSWIIGRVLGEPYGWYHKRDKDLHTGQWMVVPVWLETGIYISDSEVEFSDWIPSDLFITAEHICPKETVLPSTIYVCGDDENEGGQNFGVDGKYIKTYPLGSFPYYTFFGADHNIMGKSYGTYIFWDPVRGSWTLSWSLNSRFGWYYLPRWNIEQAPWLIGQPAPFFNYNVNSQITAASSISSVPITWITVSSTKTCNLPEKVYVCNDKTWNTEGEYHKRSELVGGAPHYQSVSYEDDSSLVITWEGTAWIINRSKGMKFAWYHLPSGDLFDTTLSWKMTSGGSDYVPGYTLESWIDSDMYVSRFPNCDKPTTTTTTSTTTSTTTTTDELIWNTLYASTGVFTTTESTTAFDHAAECPEKSTMVNWMGSVPVLEFFGETSAVIRTSVFNNIEFEIWQSEYLGFFSFSKKKCGLDLVDAFVDGRLKWSIVDKGAYYTTQFAYKRTDGHHTSLTLQFYRHSHSEENDIGSDVKDQFYVVIDGIDKVDWEGKNMEDCFTGFAIGAMEPTESTNVQDNLAKCAGWDKDLGW